MKKFLPVLILLLIAVIVIMVVNRPKQAQQENVKNIEISVYDESGELIYEKKAETGETKLIEALKKIGDLKIVSESSKYGEFITAIKEIEQDDSCFWNYYINGQYATVGVSEYDIKDSDKFEFRLEKFDM